MNINRNNYESWFLQYVDKELSASEMKAVEAFVVKHPDLQDELEGFKQVVLAEDNAITMPDKAQLLKPTTWNEAALSHQQVQLLLMADGELPQDAKQALQQAMESNVVLKHEWELLQKAKLAASKPQTMPGKEDLYRKEKIRVIPIGRILRIAVAAATIGFGWFAVQNWGGKSTNNPDSTTVATIEVKPIINTNEADSVKNSLTAPVTEGNPTPQQSSQFLALEKEQSGKNNEVTNRKNNNSIEATNTTENIKRLKEQMEPVQYASNVPATTNITENKQIQGLAGSSQQGIEESNNAAMVINTPTIENSTAALIAQAQDAVATETAVVYEFDEWDEEEDQTINIAGARINKQKFRNVYRNITRPIARAFDKPQDNQIVRK